MKSLINLLCMLLFSIIGSCNSLRILRKNNKFKIPFARQVCAFVIYSYFEFWILNCFRIVILQSDNVVLYSENIILLFFDIIFVVLGSYILYYFCENIINERKAFIFVAIILIYYIILYVIKYIEYKNINAAIYEMIYPKYHFLCGLILAMVIIAFNNISKHEESVEKSNKYVNWIVIAAFVITTIAYPAWEIYASNVGEFTFTIGEVGIPFIIYSIAIAFIIGLIGIFIDVKLKSLLLMCLWIVTICSYVQGMFLNSKLFLMDGKELVWGVGITISNVVVWIGIIVGLVVIIKKLNKYRIKIMTYSSALLVMMQLAGACSLVFNYVNSEEAEYAIGDYFSTEGLYEVASEDNIIMFVLDTYDVDYMNEVLEKYPDILSPLKGFTYFPDTVSQFSRTFPSITYMLTGEEYFYEIPQDQYVEEAFSNTGNAFWKGLEDNNFDYYIYEDEEGIIGKSTRQKAKNYVEQGHQTEAKISFMGCIEAINRMTGYRNMPYVLKKYYNYTSGTINNLIVEKRILDLPIFEANDSEVYENYRKYGLAISDTENKSLRFIHLNAAHAPYTMDENGNPVTSKNATAIGQYVGSIRLVLDYIQMLKDVGMYENATIVITADHGENYVTTELEQNTNPILFVKPKGVNADSDMKISDVYVSQNDIIPTISAIYGITGNENMGLNIFDTKGEDKTRIRIHNYAVVENTLQTKTLTYEIIGSSLDFNNWHSTGQYHLFGKYY